MNIAKDEVAVHRHVEKSHLDDAHDDQQFRDETRQRGYTCKGHHEDEHGHGDEGFALGQSTERFQRVTAFLGLEQGEDQESSEFETNEHGEVEDEGRDDHQGSVGAHVHMAFFPVQSADGRDGRQHVTCVGNR